MTFLVRARQLERRLSEAAWPTRAETAEAIAGADDVLARIVGAGVVAYRGLGAQQPDRPTVSEGQVRFHQRDALRRHTLTPRCPARVPLDDAVTLADLAAHLDPRGHLAVNPR